MEQQRIYKYHNIYNLTSIPQVQNNVFSSNILFFSLAAEHSGTYTCVATNAAAKANFTAQLIVRGGCGHACHV